MGNGLVARRELLGAEETHYSDDQVCVHARTHAGTYTHVHSTHMYSTHARTCTHTYVTLYLIIVTENTVTG